MNVLNISRLGNRIKGLFVIGKKADGSLILCGSGEKLIGFSFDYRIIFYEYDPITDELKEDIFSNLILLYSFFELCQNKVFVADGIGYFVEPEDSQRINIVKCDFNNYTSLRLFSICMDDLMLDWIQLILLSDRYFAIKLYNKKTCQFDIYDLDQLKKYNLIFAENDDMRYSYVHWIEFDGRPYIVFVKNGKPSWKMEFFINHWEWSQQFIKYKDEKIFLFPLDVLISKEIFFIDETYKIVQIGETHELKYLGYVNNCIVYSSEDLRRHYFEHDLNEAETYNDNVFLYDVGNRITRSMPYDKRVLMSNTGNLYEYKNNNE